MIDDFVGQLTKKDVLYSAPLQKLIREEYHGERLDVFYKIIENSDLLRDFLVELTNNIVAKRSEFVAVEGWILDSVTVRSNLTKLLKDCGHVVWAMHSE
jgi:hypothetical protein